MSSTIRLADAADVDLLTDLMREFYAESGIDLDEEAARSALDWLLRNSSAGRIWLVLSDGALAGYIVLTLGYSLEYYGRDAFVDDLFIRPAYRAGGLGGLALQTLEDTCRDLEVRAIHLEVGRDNHAARGLYRKWGFEDHDRLLMTKNLRRPSGTTNHGQP